MIDWEAVERIPPGEDIGIEESRLALQHLRDTDWYACRFADTGVPIPEDIKASRAEARTKVIK